MRNQYNTLPGPSGEHEPPKSPFVDFDFGIDTVSAESELKRKQRERREVLFRPIDIPGQHEDSEVPTDFSYLWDESELDKKPLIAIKKPEVKPWPVTERTKGRAEAKLKYLLYDDGFVEALNQQGIDARNIPTGVLVDQVRTNPDVRLTFGKIFLDSIDEYYHISQRGNNISRLPSRISSNGNKSPTGKVSEVDRMTSREYVALLCLAKVDGTFDEDSIRSTDRSIPNDIDRQGQHNKAADMILDYIANKTLTQFDVSLIELSNKMSVNGSRHHF